VLYSGTLLACSCTKVEVKGSGNTLAYDNTAVITTRKSFIIQAPNLISIVRLKDKKFYKILPVISSIKNKCFCFNLFQI
jgi:hypothetical protein